MQGSSSNNTPTSDHSDKELIFLAVGIMVLVGIVSYFFHKEILATALWVKYYELKLISFFVPNRSFIGLENWVRLSDAGRVSYHQLALLSSEVGNVLKWPCGLILLIFAGLIYFFHPHRAFRDIETMRSLADKVGEVFPAIKTIEGLDLVKADINKGPWRMGETPIEFMKHYKLVYKEADQGIVVDQLRAKMVFAAQLGPKWRDIEALPTYQQALFGVLAAFVNYKRAAAEEALEHIAASVKKSNLSNGRHNFSKAWPLLKKYGQSAVVKNITDKHAYVLTVFTEMLIQARKTGIVPNSMYLWLKPLDRTLWYTLNNVGRKAGFVEAASVHAHWQVEKALGYAIAEPMVTEAVNGLSEVMKTRIITLEDQQPAPVVETKKPKARKGKKR